MAQGFEAIHEQVNSALDSGSSQSNEIKENQTQGDQAPKEASSEPVKAKEQQALSELERVEKFKFQGKEYTPKELAALLKREQEAQKGYTQSRQELAEMRKNLEAQNAERKYYENLAFDLDKVRANPALAQEFIRVYPEKFHAYLKDVLHVSTSDGQKQTSSPQIPVELMSQVQRLQSFVESQEVAKAETEIESNLSKALSANKYANRKEVLADAYELHNRGTKLTAEIWNQLAEESHKNRKAEFDAYYKELVSQQSKANAKGRDVAAGGGTPGQAPKKFKDFKELNRSVQQAFGQKQ